MKKLAALAAGALLLAQQAYAAVPEAVTDGIDTATTDMTTVYTALTSAGVVIWVGRLIYNRFRVR